MINVSFGHEKGCGAEAFLKSFLLLRKEQQEHFKLFVSKEVLSSYLRTYQIKHQVNNSQLTYWGSHLNLEIIEPQVTPSTDSLQAAIDATGMNDVLLTLPTSKDQLFYQGKQVNGHTEYFRQFYKDLTITMNFINDKENVLLLTDHIPLVDVVKMSSKSVVKKINATLVNLPKITKVCVAGFNPHAGENGLIGTEDNILSEAIGELVSSHQDIEFLGPLAGDSLHYHTAPTTLKVYTAHDQALSYFKGRYGIYGANVSFGLPFVRLSVDHGTAFELFGKNCINYAGSQYTLKLALELKG